MATELAKAYVQIIPSAKGMAGNLKKELGGAQVGEQAGGLIGGGLAKKLLGVVAAAGIGAAIVKGISSAIEAGGALQQSLGGVETLFKENADTVIKNAERAYKTAGLSANEYMQNVTGFSASLLQSLGGDTAEAAKVADRAMIDMADNANKFGTDMSSITYAYQGFAKQNFTMLDNLKLGYGGTKTEMQRLIKDAAQMKDIQSELGITIDENSLQFANVANAISVMQRALGVAGTTATEAEGTFTGSMMAMQASIENFKAHLALGQDISADLESIATSISTFVFTNLLPMIGNIIKGLPKAIGMFIKTAVPKIAEQGKEFLKSFGQGFVQAGLNLGKLLNDALNNLLENMRNWQPGHGAEVAEKIFNKIGEALAIVIPAIMSRFSEALDKLLEVIDTWQPTKAAEGGNKIMDALGNAIVTYAPKILKAIGIVIGKLLLALVKALPKLALQGALMMAHLSQGIIKGIGKVLAALANLIAQSIAKLGSRAADFIKKGLQIPLNIVTGIGQGITNVLSKLGDLIRQALAKLAGRDNEFKNKGKNWIQKVIDGIVDKVTALLSKIGNIVQWVLDKFRGRNSEFDSIGRDMVSGIISGMGSKATALANKAGSLVSDAVARMKAKLDIGSPSKVMAKEVGRWIPEGIAKGIDDNQSVVDRAMGSLSASASYGFNPEFSASANENTDAQAVVNLLGGIYSLLQEGQTITIGRRDFARLVNEVS